MLRTLRSEEPTPPVVSMMTDGWGLLTEGVASLAPTSGAWESADRGVWFPVYVPTVCVARRMWWANGATVSGTYNVEAGIYLDGGYKPGAKLITTGSVAQSTATEVQFADITDTTLTPQLYWLFMSCSTTSATFMRTQIGSQPWDELMRFDQSSIGPGSAPATATPAESGSQNLYLFGFSTWLMPVAPTVSGTTVTATSATFTPSGSWADGDLMVVYATSVTTTPSLPSGWTNIQTFSDTWDDGIDSGTYYVRLAYKFKSGTGSDTFTNADFHGAIAISGASANPVQASNYASNTAGISLTTRWYNDLLVYAVGGAGTSATPPPGMTERLDYSASAGGIEQFVEFATRTSELPAATGTVQATVNGQPGGWIDLPLAAGIFTVRGA